MDGCGNVSVEKGGAVVSVKDVIGEIVVELEYEIKQKETPWASPHPSFYSSNDIHCIMVFW